MTDFANYYSTFCPVASLHKLYTRTLDNPELREFGYETIDGTFRRWLSCNTPEDLRALVTRAKVGKLNVGAVYNVAPRLRWQSSAAAAPVAMQRELVVDVDLDDYHELGICASSLPDCDKNWPMVAIALDVVRNLLEEVFGFKHILPVYSGRRGGHLWVLDKRAMNLTDDQRQAIVSFIKPTEAKGQLNYSWMINHPNIFDAFVDSIWPFFVNVGLKRASDGGFGLLDTARDRQEFVKAIDQRLHDAIVSEVRTAPTGQVAVTIIQAALAKKPEHVQQWMNKKYAAAICALLWPRIDAAVSMHMNHMLKSPYSVHPKTSRVSVPIFGSLMDFDPTTAPIATAKEMPHSFHDSIASLDAFLQAVDKEEELEALEAEQEVDEQMEVTDVTEAVEMEDQEEDEDVVYETVEYDDNTFTLIHAYNEPAFTSSVTRIGIACKETLVFDTVHNAFFLTTRAEDNPPAVLVQPGHYPPLGTRPVQSTQSKLQNILATAHRALSTPCDDEDGRVRVGEWHVTLLADAGDSEDLAAVTRRWNRLKQHLIDRPFATDARVNPRDRESVAIFVHNHVLPRARSELRVF